MRTFKLFVIAIICMASVFAYGANEETPLSIPGFESFVFRKTGENEMRLHVAKPANWKASEKLPCMLFFFGGGWSTGNPKAPSSWGRWAAKQGMVGVMADYRTKSRHGSSPEDCISDGRAAMRWIQEHADELGVDPAKIICAGESAGGHVAAWTAISKKGPGKDDPGPPSPSPAALVLLCPVTDTKDSGFGGSKRFDGSSERALSCSATDMMQKNMPPSIVFHGNEDKAVPYANSAGFRDLMLRNGNRCELVTFEGMGHMYWTGGKGAEGAKAREKTENDIIQFLAGLKLLMRE